MIDYFQDNQDQPLPYCRQPLDQQCIESYTGNFLHYPFLHCNKS